MNRIIQAEQIHTQQTTHMNRIQRELELDIEIPRESQRRRKTYLYGEPMKQYRPNKVRPVRQELIQRADPQPDPQSEITTKTETKTTRGRRQNREEANQKGEKKPERRDPQPKRLRPRRSQSENKTRPTIGKEQDESLESSSVLGPLESSSVLALFRVVGIKLQLD